MSRTSAANEIGPRAAGSAGAPGRVRPLLTWLGFDPRGDVLPVDLERDCSRPGCDRPALSGEALCPVHLGLAEDAELARTSPRLRPHVGKALVLAGLASAAGVGLALAVKDPGFGWLGAGSTGAVLGSLLARRAGWPLAGAVLGTVGFFGASILACAAVLVGLLALLPALL